jgi:hypothetical protein
VLEDQYEGNRERPFASVPHPDYGVIRFISLRVPVHYIGGPIDLAVYIPTNSSLDAYAKLVQGVQTRVYMFDTPLDA